MIRHPLIRQIRQLGSKARSGCLSAASGDEHLRIFLRDGFVEAIAGGSKKERLGQLLLDSGLLTERRLKKLLRKASRRGTAFGSVVVEQKRVAPSKLVQAVKNQAIIRLQRGLEDRFEMASFDDSEPSPGFPCKIPFNELILCLARQSVPPSIQISGPFALKHELAVELDRWPWNPEELAVLGSLLESPRSLTELRAAMKGATVETALGTLLKLGLLEHPEQGADRSEEAPRKWDLGEWIPVEEVCKFNEQLPVLAHRQSFATEQFKSLKVHLNGAGHSPQITSITSPFVEEGKSLVGSNLALACSQDPGRRVVLVDCDLRRVPLSTA